MPPLGSFFSFFASRFSAAFHKYIFLSIRHELGSFTFLLPARPYRPWSVQFSLAALQAEPSYLKSKKNNNESCPQSERARAESVRLGCKGVTWIGIYIYAII